MECVWRVCGECVESVWRVCVEVGGEYVGGGECVWRGEGLGVGE